MRKIVLSAITAAVCAAGLAMNAVAAPPPGGSSGASSMQPQQQTTVSQAELKKFADTYQAVTAIRDKYQAKLQNAKGKQEAQKIADNAQQAMKATIKQHGFTMTEYGNIIKAINNNPKLYKRFRQLTGGAS